MASESSPLLTPQAQNQDGTETDDALLNKLSDQESHQTCVPLDEKASLQNMLAVIPLLLLGIFICNADTSLVLATNGAIASDFKDLDHSGWLLTGFMLSMCATQPLYGKSSDVLGRKVMLSVAYILFVVGCFISGIGSTMAQVICGRVISGAGGSGMTALVSIIIADIVPPRQIAAWRSYVNVAATTGRSLGGPIGGYLADRVGWRWSFYGQCPPILLALALVLWRLPSSPSKKPTGPEDGMAQLRITRKLAKIDFLGAGLLAGTIVTLLLAMDLASNKDQLLKAVGLAALGLLLCGLFVWVEKRWAREPIFPLSLFGNRDVVISYLTALLQVAGQSGVMFTIPIYFQITDNATVTEAGSRLVPAVVGNAVGGLLSGFLIQRTGRYKLLSILGPVSSSVGFLLLILRWHGKTSLAELMYIIPGGFGTAVTQSTAFIQLAAGVDPSMLAIAGTSLYLSQNLGSVTGFSMAPTVLQFALRSRLSQSLRGHPQEEEIVARSISNLRYVQSLEGRVKQIIIAAYVRSLTYTYVLSLTCSLLALAITLCIRERRLE